MGTLVAVKIVGCSGVRAVDTLGFYMLQFRCIVLCDGYQRMKHIKLKNHSFL